MGKSLVIVESPAKAKTINKYLGNDFVVRSSIGHIRDLPTSGSKSNKVDPKERARQASLTRKMSPEEKIKHRKKKSKQQLVRRMGIDPDHKWRARYEILPGKEKVVNELVKLAKNADYIYLATDMDREGEAIAWHLQEAIGGDVNKYRRVVFNEITKIAIQKAFEEPGPVDMDRVNAQQARRFLDRVVGFMLSPLLWAKVARGLSAGRVQSVATRLVVEREREIRAFVPEEYWDLIAELLTKEGEKTRFEVKRFQDKAFRPGSKSEVDVALKALEDAEYRIDKVVQKPSITKPTAPFITSTLQQAASTRLGFGVKKTMMMAQRLYEAGHITYMRTDSTNVSQIALEECRQHISSEYGNKYLPDNQRKFASKSGAQDAHEAIRPTDVGVNGTHLSQLDRDAQRLYELIWRQFVACQMADARFLSTRVDIHCGEYELRANGRVLVFDGFQKVLPPLVKKGDAIVLPNLEEGQVLQLSKLLPTQHFTKPPARFTEASLVKELEKRGIGRPSTYAAIISTIQDRGYVELQSKRFHAQKVGDIVTERLVESFSDLMDYDFTATMENGLDQVANGKKHWMELLDQFYLDFSAKLDHAQNSETGGMRPNDPTETDIECPKCGRNMQIRTASTGVFLGCSGYSLPVKERCKQTMNLIPGEEAAVVDDDEEAEARLLINKQHCSICGTAMDSYLVDEKRKLHVCGNNPDCPGYAVEQGEFKIKGYDGPVLDCDKCGSEMQLKSGRFGKYFGCTNDDCSNTRKLLRSGEAAPPKMDPVPMPEIKCQKVDDHYVLRDGAAGMFLAASGFPKNRETRAPLLEEILPHKDEIDVKYKYLFSGPEKDNKGRPTVIRYSRKTAMHYLQSEVDGKASGWRATYDGKQWQIEAKTIKRKKKARRKKKKKA